MSWLREAISDENKQADMAYVAIGALIGTLIGSVGFLCMMSAISYYNCQEIVDVGQGIRASVRCKYDPNPLGIAIAACIAAFGSPIGALAGYMVATRRREPPKPPDTSTTTATATVTTETAVAPTPAAPPAAKKTTRRR